MSERCERGAQTQVRDLLGLYVLGGLRGAGLDAVEAHLAECESCCAEADSLGVVAEAMLRLTLADVRDLHPQGPTAAESPPPAPPATRGSPGRPRSRPHRALLVRTGAGERRIQAPVSVAMVGVLLVLSAGVALGLRLGGQPGDHSRPTVPVAATATASDPSSGASLSVSVVGNGPGTDVRATVVGLRAGARYELFAVTTDGRTFVVCGWVGAREVRDLEGTVPAFESTLAFFTVVHGDGSAVVSAHLARDPAPRRSGP
ncbi:zf-HC2 domain-containing protein [Actinoplanes sp. NPDC051346]|uniref:zf-HC2 domain-containing protein n=1 Tax=Actinoplanes sp. NPDC051346 TaxID=3155048 RepID=UPI0034299165